MTVRMVAEVRVCPVDGTPLPKELRIRPEDIVQGLILDGAMRVSVYDGPVVFGPLRQPRPLPIHHHHGSGGIAWERTGPETLDLALTLALAVLEPSSALRHYAALADILATFRTDVPWMLNGAELRQLVTGEPPPAVERNGCAPELWAHHPRARS